MLGDYLYEFGVVVEEGALWKAAAELGLSQSTLSRHLAALEAQLGVKLLERTPAGVRPTEDGAYAFDVARRVGAVGEELRATLGKLREG